MNEYEARQAIADAEMRKGLWLLLHGFHPDAKSRVPRTFLPPNDETIKADLKRILGLARRLF